MWQFFAVHFWAFAAGAGVLGLALIIALFLVLGWTVGGVLKALIQFATALVHFFETPIGEVLGVVILCAIAWFASDLRRTRLDAAAQEIAIQAALAQAADTAEQNRVQRDAAISGEIKAAADREIEGIEAEKAELEQRAKNYEAALSKREVCLVGPDDLAASRVRRKP